jgi:3-phenylpropionate/trans-cinnamate dioxygenase ferredoxin reductase subunit
MKTTRYLIVGGGLTGDAACKGIRKVDSEGSIVLVGEEQHAPYARPPLSKALWKGDEESTIWRGTADLGVDLQLGRRIVALDLERRQALDDLGERYAYEQLLLATGGRPRRLPFGEDVVYFRTLNGASVTIVFPEPGIGARIFPPELSRAISDHYRDRGVEVLAGASVDGIERVGNRKRILLADGRVLEAEAVVAGLGIEPNVELAESAGLGVANGIVVDVFGRADGREDVFAAGDVARFPVPVLATEMRVEHEDHAKSHGRTVGANMAGAGEPYDHLPFFYSDLFDFGYEAVGELDARVETLAELADVGDSGIVYYLDGERRPRGVLLWNLYGRVDDARELLRASEPIMPGALAERAA